MAAQSKYQVGGSISATRGTYVEREADAELLTALNNRELCYIFNSRQMGKSSLLLNIKSQLQQQGYRCCFVDMSRIGSVKITMEQWYGGLVSELWRGFSLPPGNAVFDWWNSLGAISAPQKLAALFDKIIADSEAEQEFAIFFDEIDSVLSLPFSADDFFSVIRACYNQRADQPKMRHLQFALFGVALPSDLMNDTSRSPFNIGRAIELQGFKLENSLALAQGLEVAHLDSTKLLTEVLAWSQGQPFLTQRICQLIVDTSNNDAGDNEQVWLANLLQEKIIDNWVSRDNPEHLRTIRDRMLLNDKQATFNLVTYQQLLASKNEQMSVDENADYSRLLLTGLINIEQGKITVRSKIYRQIFNEAWLEQALANRRPSAEKIALWQVNNQPCWLLTASELVVATQWAKGKHLPEHDHQFIAASQALENQQVQAWNQKLQQEIAQRQQVERELNDTLGLLEQAKAEAEQANQAKTDFLARVSHEVRTPINSVLGLSYLALQQNNSTMGQDYLTKIHRATNYMLAVVNDMVDISKLERKELTLNSEPFFLNDVINNIRELVTARLDETGLTFSSNIADKQLPLIRGDAIRLQQLLLNLVTNGIKFTQQGGISINIEQVLIADQRLHCTLVVSDSGSGISDLPITGNVSQAKESVIELGLGLSLCCQLAELMAVKGNNNQGLWLESIPKQGCQFSFSISAEIVAQGQYDHELVRDQALLSQQFTLQAFSKAHRILVVEDDEINQQIIKELLESLSLVVIIAFNGEHALALLSKQRFDLVLMDIEMPVMGGIEAVAKIRALAETDHQSLTELPIMAMTAHALVNDRQRFIELGFNEHIAKPIEPKNLVKLLTSQLGINPPSLDSSINYPAIAGVDFAKGIERCGGNSSLYFKLLQRFLSEQSHSSKISLLSLAEAVQEFHLLKGTSANLGLHAISEQAKQFEASCRQGNFPADDKLQRLNLLIEQSLQQLSQYNQVNLFSKTETAGRAKKRIILVDAVTDNLRLMTGNLKADFSIMAATTLEKAMQLTQKQPFADAILCSESFIHDYPGVYNPAYLALSVQAQQNNISILLISEQAEQSSPIITPSSATKHIITPRVSASITANKLYAMLTA